MPPPYRKAAHRPTKKRRRGPAKEEGKMKKGSLRSKKRSLEAILLRVPCICVEVYAYAYK
ncbi:hypothetical protein PIB30_084099, partial [Stylosanthes scabra]|nr:hypothetical protein [Stylosanthes scabra]